MLKAAQLRKLGLDMLADNISPIPEGLLPRVVEERLSAPVPPPETSWTEYVNPLNAPSLHATQVGNDYIKDVLIGSLIGAAGGAGMGSLLRKPLPLSILLGVGTGGLAGLLRSYDKRSDPPGISPRFTIPAGARLGAVAGALSGAGLGHYTGYGSLAGALAGTAAGTLGGALTSPLY